MVLFFFCLVNVVLKICVGISDSGSNSYEEYNNVLLSIVSFLNLFMDRSFYCTFTFGYSSYNISSILFHVKRFSGSSNFYFLVTII